MHQYAHNAQGGIRLLPQSLKGKDAIVFEVFRALGLEVALRPILSQSMGQIPAGNLGGRSLLGPTIHEVQGITMGHETTSVVQIGQGEGYQPVLVNWYGENPAEDDGEDDETEDKEEINIAVPIVSRTVFRLR